jgi:nucleotide-binding universal stress UspA family protein
MFKNIVVALNGSACATRAFELALSLAKLEGASLTLCSVIDPMAAMWSTSSGPSAEVALAEAQEGTNRLVSDAVARARAAGIAAEGHVLHGDPAGEIVACSEKGRADAIVMGTHGWTGIKHVVMGSVAEQVLRSAPCPVVVVRDRAEVPSMSGGAAS